MKRKAVILGGVLVLLLGFAPSAGATPPLDPVTIVTAIDFKVVPFSGTFEVIEGDGILGCSSGVFVVSRRGLGTDQAVFTCEDGEDGTFTFLFQPNVAVPGPGFLNGNWQAWKSTGDFAGLRGNGQFSVVIDFTNGTGVETYTGVVHYHP